MIGLGDLLYAGRSTVEPEVMLGVSEDADIGFKLRRGSRHGQGGSLGRRGIGGMLGRRWDFIVTCRWRLNANDATSEDIGTFKMIVASVRLVPPAASHRFAISSFVIRMMARLSPRVTRILSRLRGYSLDV